MIPILPSMGQLHKELIDSDCDYFAFNDYNYDYDYSIFKMYLNKFTFLKYMYCVSVQV